MLVVEQWTMNNEFTIPILSPWPLSKGHWRHSVPNYLQQDYVPLEFFSVWIWKLSSSNAAFTSCNPKQNTSFLPPCSEVIYSLQWIVHSMQYNELSIQWISSLVMVSTCSLIKTLGQVVVAQLADFWTCYKHFPIYCQARQHQQQRIVWSRF